MDGPLKLALAVLLVVAPAAATPAALPTADAPGSASTAGSASLASAPVVNGTGTTSYLVLPSEDRRTARFGSVRLDAAGSVGADTARLHGQYATTQLREAFAARESRAAQRAVVSRTADRLDARIANLTERQQQAIDAYNRGELSTREFLRELAIVDVHARSVRGTVNQLSTFSRSVGDPVEPTRIAQLKGRLIPLIGPVRQEVAATMRGDGTDVPTRVYVETSSSGVVLAMLQERPVGTAYVREAHDGAAFDDMFADNPITLDAFEDRITELYPWIADVDPKSNTILTSEPYYTRAGIYGIEYNHPHGTTRNDDLTIYYDAGTERVFREIQYKNVEAVPTRPLANESDDGLRLRVHATRPGGPLLVNVTNVSNGQPLDATVAVNGDTVGSTGDAGQLWTIAPRDSFLVEVERGDRNVSVVTTTTPRDDNLPS